MMNSPLRLLCVPCIALCTILVATGCDGDGGGLPTDLGQDTDATTPGDTIDVELPPWDGDIPDVALPRCAGPREAECVAGSCTDLDRDPAHCGACGVACQADQTCRQGRCNTSCEALVIAAPTTVADPMRAGDPGAIVAVDLDGDGAPDLVRADREGVFVAFAGADRAFETTSWLPDERLANPVALVTGDIDGDGDLDLAAPDALWRNDGAGNLEPLSAGTDYERLIVLADVDGDGMADRVVAGNETTARLATGDAAQPFGDRLTLDDGYPAVLAAGELGGDAAAEIVTVTSDGELVVIMRQPGGSFARSATVTLPTTELGGVDALGLIVLDLDDDGANDVLVGLREGTLAFAGDGAGGLSATPSSLGFGGATMQSIDLDGDDRLDVLAGDYAATVYLNRGDGTLSPPRHHAASSHLVAPPIAADFDGDGHVDLAMAPWGVDRIDLFPGDGTGEFAWTQAGIDLGVGLDRELFVGDVDGDGRHDVVVNDPGHAVRVFFGTAEQTFAPARPWPVATIGSHRAVVGDVDGDGLADLIVSDYTTDALALYAGRGDGTFAEPVPAGADGVPRALLDWGGTPVLLDQVDSEQRLRPWRDGAFADPVASHVWTRHAIADLDADGYDDIVAIGSQGLEIHRADGAGGLLAPQRLLDGDALSTGLAVGDLDGDGHLDIVTGDGYLLGDGEGGVSGELVARRFGNVHAVDAGRAFASDDGTVIAATSIDGARQVWPLDNSYSDVLVGDFDGDDRLDLATGPTVLRALFGADGGLTGAPQRLGVGSFTTARIDARPGDELITAVREGDDVYAVAIELDEAGTRVTRWRVLDVLSVMSRLTALDVDRDGRDELFTAQSLETGGTELAAHMLRVLDDDRVEVVAVGPRPTGSFTLGGITALAQIDGSGWPDLVIGDHLLVGHGPLGPWQHLDSLGAPIQAVADFDGDGLDDLLVADYLASTSVLHLANGDGTWRAGSALGASVLDVATGDVDDDGAPDLVVITTEGHLQVRAGTGLEAVAEVVVPGARDLVDVSLADLDGDGRLDVLVLTSDTLERYVLEGTTLERTHRLGVGGTQVLPLATASGAVRLAVSGDGGIEALAVTCR